MARKSFKFDQALEELEGLVTQLESGDIGLEDALKVFEKGVKLTRDCQQVLDGAEQKVEKLMVESGLNEQWSQEQLGDETAAGDESEQWEDD